MCGKFRKMLNTIELSGYVAYSVITKQHLFKKNIIIPTKNDENAIDIAEDILMVSGVLKTSTPQIVTFAESDIFSRIKAISQILVKDKILLCASTDAINKKTFSPTNFKKSIIKLKKYDVINRDLIISKLSENGYDRLDMVTDFGEFSVRGEIIDIWCPTYDLPVRIVFNVNNLESIKNIDPNSQRSVAEINEVNILPVKEKEESTIFEYFKDNCYIFTDKDIVDYLPVPEFNGNIELFKEKYFQWQNEDFQIFIIANNEGDKRHFSEILGKGYEKSIFTGQLSNGFVIKKDKIVFITTNEIFSRYKLKIRPPKYFKELGEPIESLTEINKDDFIVHEKYGIGIYNGLQIITAGGITAEYISISYANNDKLFVPVNDFNKIQKYFGVGERYPKINSLDSTLWEHTRAVADENAKKLAQQLLQVYAERSNVTRPPFSQDTDFEKEFEEEFIYEETPDQVKAVEDIKNDMLSSNPMERCIFGDTGFGKTEIAMRAALKCVLSGKQVCFLAPTTVLVQQHEQTFLDRFADWPVKIATISRFKTKKEQKEIIEKLKNGKIDIVIGTHRLLSKDIGFINLGLLVIDEEHRFGVADKEKIKMLKQNVDCLYLTATPIPRTLSMALSGIKNMSTIETPPVGRQAVETVLLEYSEKIISDAIMYEISRGGQVFYIHNRIGTIKNCVDRLKILLPNVKFDYLHGRMSASEIEDKMLKFLKKEFDCLISTTIIEAGLDIPNVNTIIVEESDNFGLGQLYQLRGRVGRSKIKAYCYLFYKTSNLTEIAEKRLSAIKEFAKLGSGFHLALKDLQIRGAGEILGKRQHGYISSIGFDMYLKLLEKYSNEMKGIETKEEIIPEINIQLNAIIPSEYISEEIQRISFYKKILTAVNIENLIEIKNEMNDRFGNLPEETENLFEAGEIRIRAKKLGIIKISSSDKSVKLEFSSDTPVEPSRIFKILEKSSYRFIKSNLLEINFDESQPRQRNLNFIKNLLQSF
ncbi:MAG: transcription-repair coupling factor [Elusimicrobia bacterium RIFOXYD2_FULL_34_15]|nr:MAG: transcription-repair coupling factor [Elusimicrobia bacterium RIFOXYD2_FULL_34_15]